MKRKIQKKLTLRKVTIAAHQIYGGSLDTDPITPPSSAFHEPTEPPVLNPIIINTVDPEDPTLVSGNQQTCM